MIASLFIYGHCEWSSISTTMASHLCNAAPVTPSPSKVSIQTSKRVQSEKAGLLGAAMREMVVSQVHNGYWMTADALLHHLNRSILFLKIY
jgi:hypothetical protein